MDTVREDRLEELFEEALLLVPDQRAAWLEHVCAGDRELRLRLETLLARAEEAQVFVDQVIGPALTRVADVVLADASAAGHEHPDPLIGQQIAHFQISGKLGGGGMGVVYQARDVNLGRTVALKFLSAHLCRDPEAKQRFVQEAKAASALDHPNICIVHEIGETETGQLFLAMAYYAGETLEKKIARGVLPVEEAVAYAVQIAEGLAAAHGAGIIHRDVKPANVLVTRGGVAKIVDFGLAKLPDVHLTRLGMTAGTVAYMSPEQTRGDSVDSRTDLWSLGVVLYEMLTGSRPFRGDAQDAIVYAIRHDDAQPVEKLRAEVLPQLAHVVRRCLAKEPALRYGSAAALLTDLRAAGQTIPEAEVQARSEREAKALPLDPSVRELRSRRVFGLAKRLHGAGTYQYGLRFAALPAGLLALLVGAALAPWVGGRFARPAVEQGAVNPGSLVANGRDNPAVAVLRLQAVGPRGDRGWLAEALQVGLIDALSRSSGLVVRSHEAVAAHGAAGLSPESLGKILDVDFLVSGSVASWDDGVAFTVQLSEATAGTVVTSRTFQVPGELFALETVEEVNNRVAEHLLEVLGAEVRIRGWRAATSDPEAFRLRFQAADLETTAREFLRYRDHRAAERAYHQADSLLATAAVRAPAWMEPRLARAILAERRADLAIADGRAPEFAIGRFRAGIAHSEEVLRGEPQHAAALALRGRLRWRLYHYTDFYIGTPRLAEGPELLDSAERDLRRALDLDPSLATAAAALSALLHIGRHFYGEGRVFAQRAMDLDGFLEDASSILHRIAMASHELGEDSAALAWCREGVRRFAEEARHHACVLDVLAWGDASPDPDTAWEHYKRMLELIAPADHTRVEPYYTSAVASVLARSGLSDSSRAVLDRLRLRHAGPLDTADQDLARMLWLEAAVRFRLGDTDSAHILVTRFREGSPDTAPHLLERRILRDFVDPSGPTTH